MDISCELTKLTYELVNLWTRRGVLSLGYCILCSVEKASILVYFRNILDICNITVKRSVRLIFILTILQISLVRQFRISPLADPRRVYKERIHPHPLGHKAQLAKP